MPTEQIVKLEITDGMTFGKLMEEAGVSGTVSAAIFAAAEPVYDLSKVRLGRTIDLVYDITTDQLKRVVYQIDTEEELHVTLTPTPTSTATTTVPEVTSWTAERIRIAYEVKVIKAGGTIESSMYQAALDSGIDERAIIELANAFQWSVDFALDVRVGDTFTFIYEERYRDGEYVMPGQIMAGKYVNDGTEHYVFYFEDTTENSGYFDREGNSVQKMFLKAPVAFKYISSGYTTGPRYVAAFKQYNPSHRGIDYAASAGTPVRSVGDGTVTSAGWNGPYGNFITVRHNGTYSTNYGHLSGFAIRKGQSVSQGQTIGYVGSTGYSTGPHLHYEMVKNGEKINPLREVLPPGKPIADENREAFTKLVTDFKARLDE